MMCDIADVALVLIWAVIVLFVLRFQLVTFYRFITRKVWFGAQQKEKVVANPDSKYFFDEYKKVRTSLDMMVRAGSGDSKEAHSLRSVLIDYWNSMKPPEQKEIAKLYIG